MKLFKRRLRFGSYLQHSSFFSSVHKKNSSIALLWHRRHQAVPLFCFTLLETIGVAIRLYHTFSRCACVHALSTNSINFQHPAISRRRRILFKLFAQCLTFWTWRLCLSNNLPCQINSKRKLALNSSALGSFSRLTQLCR